jgi:hypothetical protein
MIVYSSTILMVVKIEDSVKNEVSNNQLAFLNVNSINLSILLPKITLSRYTTPYSNN